MLEFVFDCSLQLDLPRLPCLVEPRLLWAVENIHIERWLIDINILRGGNGFARQNDLSLTAFDVTSVDRYSFVISVSCNFPTEDDRSHQKGGTALALMPFPFSFNLCGLSRALSFSFKRALRPPVRDGVKVTSSMQALSGSTVAPVHVSLSRTKEFGLSPPRSTLSMCNGWPPLFLSVILFAALVRRTT